ERRWGPDGPRWRMDGPARARSGIPKLLKMLPRHSLFVAATLGGIATAQTGSATAFDSHSVCVLGRVLDPGHVGIRQAEMVADLVHQHMLHDCAQGLLVLGPIVEDRPAVEPDHIRHLHRIALGTE